jgi:hypothetical protein
MLLNVSGIDDVTFDTLRSQWNWKPIRHCPGRYKLAGVRPDLPLEALVGPETVGTEFSVESAPDRVVVACLDGGGIISYKRSDGTYLHTLNDPEGFARKLRHLGIVLPSTC